MDEQQSLEFMVQEEYIPNVKDLNRVVSTKKTLRVLHLNIRSASKHYKELDILLENINKKPDFIICTETWEVQCTGFFNLKNYFLHYAECNITKAGGVIVYVNSKFDKNDIIIEKKFIGRIAVLDLKIPCEKEFLYITGIYRPHKIKKDEFVEDLNVFLKQIKNRSNHMVIGDINLNTFECTDLVEEYLNNYCELGYRSYINAVTRPKMGQENFDLGTCIDHLFLRHKDFLVKSYVIDGGITDHHMIMADLDMELKTTKKEPKFYVDMHLIKQMSKKCDWKSLLLSKNVNECTNDLVKNIKDIIENSKKQLKHRSGKKRKWWITKGLIKSCDNKKKMSMALKRNPNNKALQIKYKKYTKILNKLLNIAEQMFDSDRFLKIKNDSKKIWQFLNEKLGKEKRQSRVVNSIIKIIILYQKK